MGKHSISRFQRKKEKMCSDLGTGSRCCAMYSFCGALFTFWVWIIIHTQGFYIAGLEDEEKGIQSAFGAMVMFLVTFVASCYGIHVDNSNKIEEIPNSAEGYQLNQGPVSRYD